MSTICDTERVFEIREKFGIDALALVERQARPLKSEEVRIRVKAVSLNQRDLRIIKGLHKESLPSPLVPISDGSGEVVEVGDRVNRIKVGERVAAAFMQDWITGDYKAEYADSALGGEIEGLLSDYAVVGEEGIVRIPDYLSFEQAATLPLAAVTAWNSVVATGRVKAGDTVLTMGTGGVSLFALQFAKMAGAKVIIISSSDDKLAKAKALGADEGINYKREREWSKEVLRLTGGKGVELVVELGGPGTLDQSLKAVGVGGSIILMGDLAGSADSSFNLTRVTMKSIRLQSICAGSRLMFEEMLRSLSVHKLAPVIDKIFAFEDVKEALTYLESGTHFGKVVVKVN